MAVELWNCENACPVHPVKLQSTILQGEVFISVYPNPAKDKIIVSLTKDRIWQEWKIYDLSGRQIMQGEIQFQDIFDISGLTSLKKGFYILKVFDKEGKIGLGKFVVK